MKDENASVPGVPAAPDTRMAELAVIARESGMSARLADWMIDGTTVAAARSEAFQALRASAPAPVNVAAPAIEVGKVAPPPERAAAFGLIPSPAGGRALRGR